MKIFLSLASSLALTMVSSNTLAQTQADLSGLEIEKAYYNKDGKLIIKVKRPSDEKPAFLTRNQYFYGDNDGFYQLNQAGYSGSTGDYSVGFEDDRVQGVKDEEGTVRNADRGQFFANEKKGKYHLQCDKEKQKYKQLSGKKKDQLQAQMRAGKVKLNPLPDTREPAYLLKQNGSDRIVYVDEPVYRTGYDYDFRMFVGTPGNMKEVKVTREERFRDGGTTIVEGEDGTTMYSPSAFKRDLKPEINGNSAVALDTKTFDLKSLGIEGVPAAEPMIASNTPCDKFFASGNSNSSRTRSESSSGRAQ
jgi:hypothetical protein